LLDYKFALPKDHNNNNNNNTRFLRLKSVEQEGMLLTAKNSKAPLWSLFLGATFDCRPVKVRQKTPKSEAEFRTFQKLFDQP